VDPENSLLARAGVKLKHLEPYPGVLTLRSLRAS
jgi:hypothetical protein